MKTPFHRLFTLILAMLVSLILPDSFTAYAGALHEKSAAPAGVHKLADLPPDARAAITNALEREGVSAPEEFTERAKLSSSGSGSAFGLSVAIWGDTVVVGDPEANSFGAAYVFVKPAGGWASGLESAKLVASDGNLFDSFGWTVTIAGDTVVVGSFKDEVGPYVFVKPAGGWTGVITESAKLTTSDRQSGDLLGITLALAGDTVVVGAYLHDVGGNSDQGSAYVFLKPAGGWTGLITESAKLTTSDGRAGQNFGYPVAIFGDKIVAGATGTVSAYVFVKPPGGWAGLITQSAKLTPSDGSSGLFGSFAAIEGATVAVGAIFDNASHGSVYVFVEPSGGWAGTLTQNAKLSASDGQSGDSLGVSIAIAGDRVVAGARRADVGGNVDQGAVYLFVKPATGWVGTITESGKFSPSAGTPSAQFGYSVAISGETFVTGSVNCQCNGVYVFENALPDIRYVIDYRYRFASGTRQSGTNTLFADGTFQDSTGSGGTWALSQAGRLTLQYQGAPCNAFLGGRFRTPTTVAGPLRCTDGSGDTGSWQGTVIQQ